MVTKQPRSSRLAAIVITLAVAACGAGRKTTGELVVAVSSDMNVPKDLSTVIVEVTRPGSAEPALRFDLGAGKASLPLTIAVPAREPRPDEVTIRVTGWKADALRVVREAHTTVPPNRKALLTLELQWLCNEQVQPGASLDSPQSVRSSCDDGLTCVLGECRRIAVATDGLPDWDPTLVYGGGNGPGAGSCLDVGMCFRDVPAIAPRPNDCSVARPSGGPGVNVAIVLPPNRDGFCDGQRCLIPLDGFNTDLGWSESGGRVALPSAVCERVADGRLLGVAVSDVCPTKTVSIPICSWRDTPGGRDAGVSMPTPVPVDPTPTPTTRRDAGTTPDAAAKTLRDGGSAPRPDASPPTDARPLEPTPACSSITVCGNGDGCCPGNCNAVNDDDCGPRCGNGVIEGSELCDGDCPTACPQQACTLRKLQSPNTCQARCVDSEKQSACRGGDNCCPSGCTQATDSDCACVPTTEVCNGKDDNCNGQIDEGAKTRFYRDQDGDGYGEPSRTTDACSAPAGYVANASDCDDGNPNGHPGGTEVCNGRDDDCNGSTDEGVRSTFYRDADGDGYGAAGNTTQACTAPASYAGDATDCDDGRTAVHPGATERCNLIDDDCNGATDEGCAATEVLSFSDNLAQLTARHADCTPAAPFSDWCYSAARRTCTTRSAFSAGGYGTIDYDGAGDYSIVCLNRNIAQAQYFTFASLQSKNAGCIDNTTAWTLPCFTAVDLACQDLGFGAGLGPVEHEGNQFQGICVNGALRVRMAPSALAAYDAGCNSAAVAISAACANAYHAYCVDQGYASGFGPTSAGGGDGIRFVCVPAQ